MEHLPLGSGFSRVLFGDQRGRQITATLQTQSVAEARALEALLNLGKVLLFQSPVPDNFYFTPMAFDAVDMPVQETRVSSAREHAITWIEVATP